MRASKICSQPRCPNFAPCPDHAPEPWAGSSRSERTISGSRQQRRARYVLDRDDDVCHVCGNAGADQVDHVVPLAEGGEDSEANLAPIHSVPCHRDKTLAEAARARRTPGG